MKVRLSWYEVHKFLCSKQHLAKL